MKTIGQAFHNGERYSKWLIQAPFGEVLWVAEHLECINAEKWENVGWILLADAKQGDGTIYETREHSGSNGVAAFIARKAAAVELNELQALTSRVARLEDKVTEQLPGSRLDNMEKQIKAIAVVLDSFRGYRQMDHDTEQRLKDLENAVVGLARDRVNASEVSRIPPADAMTFWDHAFIHAYCGMMNAGIVNKAESPMSVVIRNAVNVADELSIARDKHMREK